MTVKAMKKELDRLPDEEELYVLCEGDIREFFEIQKGYLIDDCLEGECVTKGFLEDDFEEGMPLEVYNNIRSKPQVYVMDVM